MIPQEENILLKSNPQGSEILPLCGKNDALPRRIILKVSSDISSIRAGQEILSDASSTDDNKTEIFFVTVHCCDLNTHREMGRLFFKAATLHMAHLI